MEIMMVAESSTIIAGFMRLPRRGGKLRRGWAALLLNDLPTMYQI